MAEEKAGYIATKEIPKDELARMVKDLESQMKKAAKNLEFEKAALLRDQVYELRKQLVSEAEILHEFAETAYGSLSGRRPRPGGARETSNRTRRGKRPRVRYGK